MARTAGELNKRIVTVRNPQGHALHCILEEPAGGALGAKFAAVLLCPGIKTRLGPHRLYRKLAQTFLSRGIPVMRVDFHGLGDSEGELPESRLEDLYDQVQFGRHVDDVRSVLDWLEMQCGIQRCIVGGLCGAAITGLLAAQQDARVAGLYAIGLPVALEGNAAPSEKQMTLGELRSERVSYLRKLVRPGSWMRLLSLKSDYRLMWRMMTFALCGTTRRGMARAQLADVPAPSSEPSADLNPRFAPAFFELLGSGRPALLVFSERDRLRWQYEEKFAQPWAQALEPYKALLTTVIVPNANHILGDPASIAEASRFTGAWLEANFAAANLTPVARIVTRIAVAANRMRTAPAA